MTGFNEVDITRLHAALYLKKEIKKGEYPDKWATIRDRTFPTMADKSGEQFRNWFRHAIRCTGVRHFSELTDTEQFKASAYLKRTEQNPVSVADVGEESVHPLDQRKYRYGFPPELEDVDEFFDWQKRQGTINAVVVADAHLPEINSHAYELALKLINYLKPDIIVNIGDHYDFETISRFDTSYSRIRGDVLEEIREPNRLFWDGAFSAHRLAKAVIIPGNHCYRIIDHVTKNAPNLYRTALNAYVDITRADGRVWHVPQISTHIHNMLRVQHGTKANINAAKSESSKLGFGISSIQGHIHRLSSHVEKVYQSGGGLYKLIQSVNIPALCKTVPPYDDRENIVSTWYNGIAHATVNLEYGVANINPILFHPVNKPDDNYNLNPLDIPLCAFYGTKTFAS